jgi:hypothetical protein
LRNSRIKQGGGIFLKLYNVSAIAQFLDLSERRVRQLKDGGIIEEYKGKPGLYELRPTVRAYVNYLRQSGAKNDKGVDYFTERAKLMRAKREDVEYDLALKKGKLHTEEEVSAAMADTLINFKSRLTAIPAKLSPILAKKSNVAEIHRILKESHDEALKEFADYEKTHS